MILTRAAETSFKIRRKYFKHMQMLTHQGTANNVPEFQAGKKLQRMIFAYIIEKTKQFLIAG
jgi:hypothetical protein